MVGATGIVVCLYVMTRMVQLSADMEAGARALALITLVVALISALGIGVLVFAALGGGS